MSNRIKFNSQAEFAKAIIENDLMDGYGSVYSYDDENYPYNPYRYIVYGNNEHLNYGWDNWECGTFTIVKKSMFPDKSLVLCWNIERFYAILRFWDAENNCTFNADGKRNGYRYDNYELFTGTPPKHMEEFKNRLED